MRSKNLKVHLTVFVERSFEFISISLIALYLKFFIGKVHLVLARE